MDTGYWILVACANNNGRRMQGASSGSLLIMDCIAIHLWRRFVGDFQYWNVWI